MCTVTRQVRKDTHMHVEDTSTKGYPCAFEDTSATGYPCASVAGYLTPCFGYNCNGLSDTMLSTKLARSV